MTPSCRVCGSELSSADLNEAKTLASCKRCKAVTSLSTDTTLAVRAPVVLPRGYEVVAVETSLATGFRDAASLAQPTMIRWSWRAVRRPSDLWMTTLSALAWNAFSLWMFVRLLMVHAWALSAFLMIFVLCGIALAKVAAEKLFNTTTIRLDADVLSIRVTPIRAALDRSVAVREIDQLYCREDDGGDCPLNYSLVARLRGGTDLTLVDALEKPEQALYLESLLEHQMRIEDRPVKGEM